MSSSWPPPHQLQTASSMSCMIFHITCSPNWKKQYLLVTWNPLIGQHSSFQCIFLEKNFITQIYLNFVFLGGLKLDTVFGLERIQNQISIFLIQFCMFPYKFKQNFRISGPLARKQFRTLSPTPTCLAGSVQFHSHKLLQAIYQSLQGWMDDKWENEKNDQTKQNEI